MNGASRTDTHNASDVGFLAQGGEMGQRMRAFDWSRTRLGPLDSWPQSLRTSVSICLNSRFPMIIWWGPDLTVLYNDSYIPALGTKHPERALGRPGREVWSEVWPVVEPLLMRVITKGEANWADDLQLFLNKVGYLEECYFTFSYSPISDESGGIGGVFTPVSDTTLKVIAERRLRTLRELADRSNRAQTVHNAYVSLAQAIAENPYDVPFAALYQVSPDRKEARLTATAGIAPGSQLSPEIVFLSNQGSAPLSLAFREARVQTLSNLEGISDLPAGPWGEPPSAIVFHPINNPGQSEVESILVAGISARKHLNDDYRSFLELVAKQIGTAVAAARAYQEEKRRAEALAELDRAKTTFFSNVSHEFRTPLTLMLGPLEQVLAASHELPAEVNDHVLIAYRNGLRLQKLVNTLLDFSRIEAGRMRASYQATDLAEFTVNLASTFRSVIQSAGLHFVVNCPSLSKPVWVDREMWEKVVLNLLSNAFKYTFEGSVTVTLSEHDGRALLSVQDTGIGIIQDQLPHLFERFHRVEGAHGRTQEGTGIGLALVAELVKMHEGTVSVTSTPGQGSTFVVSLPLGSVPQSALLGPGVEMHESAMYGSEVYGSEVYGSGVHRLEVHESHGSQSQRGGSPSHLEETEGTILLADDNADMLDYVTKLLKSRYRVTTAFNGREALSKAIATTPDLILADVMMPEMDGFQLVQSLRSHPNTRDVPVVLLSARAGEEARGEGLHAGADDYLIKPFSAHELLARVGAHLRLSRFRKEAQLREANLRAEAEAARDQAVSVLESITDGFLALDHNWCFTYVNPVGERMLGSTLDQLRGRNHWELYPGTLGTIGEREYRRAVREGHSVEFDLFYPPWEKWYSIKAYPTEAGGLSVYFRDVTEYKKAQESLAESEERFRQLADNISQCAWMADQHGNVFWFNQRWYDYTGGTFEEMRDWGWQKVHHPDHASRVIARLKHSFQNGDIWQDTFPIRGKHGEWRWFLSHARPIRDNQGQILRWFGTNTDMTQQLETELELRRTNKDLEQFAFSASHDLQEPLRTVSIYCELLKRNHGPHLDPQSQKYLSQIIDAASQMRNLVSDLLDYLHAASIDDSEPPEIVEAESVFEQVRASLSQAISESNAQLTRDILPSVAVKSTHLNQLLQNLIGNALKYRKDDQPPRVHLSASTSGNFHLFAVKDNGIGIAPQFHQQVFGVFKRLHAKNGKYPGTGIGLAICQRIVERYGGRIWLESEPGKGTTFYFTVPAISGAGTDLSAIATGQQASSYRP